MTENLENVRKIMNMYKKFDRKSKVNRPFKRHRAFGIVPQKKVANKQCVILQNTFVSGKSQWQIIIHKVKRKISFSINVGNLLDLLDVSNYKLFRKFDASHPVVL
jgi:hypothetical protein